MHTLTIAFIAIAIYAVICGTYGAAIMAVLFLFLIFKVKSLFKNRNPKLKSKSEIED